MTTLTWRRRRPGFGENEGRAPERDTCSGVNAGLGPARRWRRGRVALLGELDATRGVRDIAWHYFAQNHIGGARTGDAPAARVDQAEHTDQPFGVRARAVTMATAGYGASLTTSLASRLSERARAAVRSGRGMNRGGGIPLAQLLREIGLER